MSNLEELNFLWWHEENIVVDKILEIQFEVEEEIEGKAELSIDPDDDYNQVSDEESNHLDVTYIDGGIISEEENFSEVKLFADPPEGGEIKGEGIFAHEEEVTVEALSAEDYFFLNWTEDGEKVSTDVQYTFEVEENREFVANFGENPDPEQGFYDIANKRNYADAGEVIRAIVTGATSLEVIYKRDEEYGEGYYVNVLARYEAMNEATMNYMVEENLEPGEEFRDHMQDPDNAHEVAEVRADAAEEVERKPLEEF